MRLLIVSIVLGVVALLGHATPARADTVALLPLDAEARLEIYGQPVASELARALVAGGLDVVVIGPKMAVPERAKLIVDGSIKRKGDAIALAIRIRNPVDGTVLQTLDEQAASLATIDQAAARLSARALPLVRERLAALAQAGARPPIEPRSAPARAAPKQVLVGIGVPRGASPRIEPLRVAMIGAVEAWTQTAQRQLVATDLSTLGPQLAAETLRSKNLDRAVGFEVLGLSISKTADHIPLARARVRVSIADRTGVVFERVIATDTIVGERGMTDAALASRAAREVLAILRPHLRRQEPSWR